MVDPKDRKLKNLQKIIDTQAETIKNLQAVNRRLKSENKKQSESLIKINGITMRIIHDE